MEKIEKKISLQNHARYIEEMSFFGWSVENIRKDDEYAYVTIIRDPEMKNYDKIKELEKKWFSYTYPPLWPMILFCVIAFGLFTALLVMWIMQKESFDSTKWLLALGLPAFGFLTMSTIYFGYRVSRMKRILDKMEVEQKEIKAQALLLLEDSKNERQDNQGKEN